MIKGKIEKIAFGGQGILRHQGFVTFVPFTAPGDVVKVEVHQRKKSFSLGKLVSVTEPSASRISPKCSYFGMCGGCQFQHLEYNLQLEIKRLFVEESLSRIAKIYVTVPPVIKSTIQWKYRRHITLKLEQIKHGFQAGYTQTDRSTHLPIKHCELISEQADPIFANLQAMLAHLDNRGIPKGTLKIFKTQRATYSLVFSFRPVLPANRKSVINKFMKDFSNIQGVLMVSNGIRETYGHHESILEINHLKIKYSPLGFIQNHPEQSNNIYFYILSLIEKPIRKVLDLYCGIGITSLLLAQKGFDVLGVEDNVESYILASQNAIDNKLSKAKFMNGRCELLLPEILKDFEPDCILMNPPRTGLESTIIHQIVLLQIPHLVYISCMPSTLARDLKLFIENGYELKEVKAFDMFPQTTHVETVVTLCRRGMKPLENHLT